MKPGPLAAAIALAAFLVVRRRKLEPTLLVGGAVGVLGLLVYGSGLVELPNIERLVEDLGEILGRWTYLVVPVMAFLETGAFVGLLAPGETFMVLGGVVAGQGRVDLVTLIGLVWAAAIAGDVTSFYLGRRLGRQFLERHGPKVSITEERLHQVERFFDRHGGKAILIGRFVGLVRAVAPFLAGSSGMPFRRFIPYDIVGAGLWGTAFLVLGYVFWQRFADVLNYAEKGAFALGATIGVVVAVVWLVRHLRVPANRERIRVWLDAQADRPALRPAAKVLRPLWRGTRRPRRFLWHRLTPGELGLEMTTLLAVLAVGSFAFAGNLITLQDVTLAPGDDSAFELAADLRDPVAVDVATVLTALGSLTVVGLLTAGTAIGVAVRGRYVDACALLAGLLITFAGVHLTKDAEGRPRPAGGLVETDGDSYPSGHAAYAVAWVAVAVVIARSVPGWARGTALVVAAVVVAAVVGLTRVYLRAHYLSDVLGGAGLAASVFALCGMAGLLVGYLRHNGART